MGVNKSRPKNKRVNWEEAFKLYCTELEDGRMRGLWDLNKELGISFSSLGKHASENDWFKRRKKMKKKELEAWERSKEQEAKKLGKKQFVIWNNSISLMQRQQRILARQLKEAEEKGKKVYAKELRDTMEALRIAMNGARITMGLPTEITKGEMTNFNSDVSLTPEEIEEIDKDFNKKDDENKKPN